jgi:ornithine cyclodeaminase/alanine dehydrogenase-like protein (mu-crystallin family)
MALILGHHDVLAALTPEQCEQAMVEVLAAHARGESYFPLRSVVVPPHAAGFFGLMPAWRSGREDAPAVFALKALCLIPSNPSRGLDTHQGTVTLFDGETGQPSAILDASAVTAVRTAAVSAAATRLLARADARKLAILGAGVQARAHLRALGDVRAFESIVLHSRRTETAYALAREPGAVASGRSVRVLDSAEEAVRDADVVVTATTAREPVLAREWLKAGAHVNAVGASTPAARELDTATVADCALFVDSRESLINEAAEYQAAVREGAFSGVEHVRAELGEVFAGLKPGRRDDAELTVFRSLGVAIEDLAAATLAVSRARSLGLGTEVRL